MSGEKKSEKEFNIKEFNESVCRAHEHARKAMIEQFKNGSGQLELRKKWLKRDLS